MPWKKRSLTPAEEKEEEKKKGEKTEDNGQKQLFHRYYHVFREGELEALVEQVEPKVRIVESYYDQGNWCVIFQKI